MISQADEYFRYFSQLIRQWFRLGSVWVPFGFHLALAMRHSLVRNASRPRSLTFEGDRKAAMVPYQPFYRDYPEWNRAKERVENRLDRKDEHARDEEFEEL